MFQNTFPQLKENEKIVMEDMLKRLADLFDREMENRIALAVRDDHRVKLLMTIPGINVYSAAVIISEIDDISRFKSKEKLASYSGLVPRQDQSGSRDIRGAHIKERPLYAQICSGHCIPYSYKEIKEIEG